MDAHVIAYRDREFEAARLQMQARRIKADLRYANCRRYTARPIVPSTMEVAM